ncbi:hypothetical protein FMEAI12_6680016 [Parafrankia sp. Ea1.12]|nr:hypothetical protein FMEAI12_6680016 [Parafrankia sp. Ea1.12]
MPTALPRGAGAAHPVLSSLSWRHRSAPVSLVEKLRPWWAVRGSNPDAPTHAGDITLSGRTPTVPFR